MDDLKALHTPKKNQPGKNHTPASTSHKRHPPHLPPFSPAGVRRRVRTKGESASEKEGECILDIAKQKSRGRGEATHADECVLPTPRSDNVARKTLDEQHGVLRRTSTREISTQRDLKDEGRGGVLRLSGSWDQDRTRQQAFQKLSTSLKQDILSHRRENVRDTVGNWNPERPTPTGAEQMLCRFDVIPEYGPCCGISRRERWQLAEKLGIAPPSEVVKALLVSRKDISIFDQRLAKFGVKNPGPL